MRQISAIDGIESVDTGAEAYIRLEDGLTREDMEQIGTEIRKLPNVYACSLQTREERIAAYLEGVEGEERESPVCVILKIVRKTFLTNIR